MYNICIRSAILTKMRYHEKFSMEKRTTNLLKRLIGTCKRDGDRVQCSLKRVSGGNFSPSLGLSCGRLFNSFLDFRGVMEAENWTGLLDFATNFFVFFLFINRIFLVINNWLIKIVKYLFFYMYFYLQGTNCDCNFKKVHNTIKLYHQRLLLLK